MNDATARSCGEQDAPLSFICYTVAALARLPARKTRLWFSSRHCRGTRVFVFHCAHPRLGCGDSPPALHATMLRLTPQRDILHRKVADLRSARRGPYRGGMTRPKLYLRHCRGTRDLVTHSTTARLGSGDSPPAWHANRSLSAPIRDLAAGTARRLAAT